MYTDWRGTPIGVGSIIIYATCASSSVHVNEAEVVQIIPNPDAYAAYRVRVLDQWMQKNGYDPEKARAMDHWKNLLYKLKARRISRPYGAYGSWTDIDKPVTISSVERVTVIG